MMRDRLISLLCGVECAGSDRREGGCGYRDGAKCNRIEKLDYCMIACIADHFLANGGIVPPCKVGDVAYHLTNLDTLEELNVAEIFEGTVCSISKDEKTLWIFCRYNNGLDFWYAESDIGRNLFLTREEAERALEGMEQ